MTMSKHVTGTSGAGPVIINDKSYTELKRLYKDALAKGRESFMFEGYELDVGYAQYFLEYLQMEGFN